MGKASRWFRALLGAKKSSDFSEKKWASARSSNSNDPNIGGSKGSYAEASSSGLYVESSIDANKHAIAVAAATAAVAEAAIAAAHAAAEVVKLTSGGGTRPTTAGTDRRRELAAVKIQSAFRTYLARRALRALKGLVRLQALVRGHIVRKQSADVLRRMQAMARIQARASANRSHSHPPESHEYLNPLQSLATTKKCNSQLRAYGSSKSDRSPILKSSQSNTKTTGNVDWLGRWMKESSWNSSQGDITSLKTGHANDERSDKILEVDTWKPRLNPKRGGEIFRTTPHVKALPSRSLNFPIQEDEEAVGTTSEKNSPQVVYSAASCSRGGPFTPAKSECSRSFFSDYPGYYPNYMANTESSRAKLRSQSAPRTRMQVEKLGSRRMFDHGFRDADTVSERAWTSHSNFSTEAYPGSGSLDRPVVAVTGKSTNSNNSTYVTGK